MKIICTCFEVRKNKATGRRETQHGRMTLRGSVGTAGRLRFKCRNRHCGRTALQQAPRAVAATREPVVHYTEAARPWAEGLEG